ncbi:alpha-L-fucosidase [Flavobacterium nackdongense]|nr:alpha-L-fucosidase [Flavobacterium nackdongense]
MKNIFILLVTICMGLKLQAQTSAIPAKMEWWSDAKFGMFIHWGLYSQAAGYWKGHKAKGGGQLMLNEKIPLEEYSKIALDFKPIKFDAENWVLLAKNAGQKYIVITAKHHDGFSMFNSPSSKYNIKVCTPYAKDPIKDLADACHKHGIKFGFYYSLGRDWEDPDVPTNWPTKGARSNLVDYPNEDQKVFNRYFERKVKPQIKELLTQYGTIDILWFDTPEMISPTESKELLTIINTIQPNCIINSRIGNNLGDYKVLEQKIGNTIQTTPWESCVTISKDWGYVKYDSVYKSPELITRHLLETVAKGGNYLLNVAPTGLGEITQPARERLETIGKWMLQNGVGIYGTRPWKIDREILDKTTTEMVSIVKETENEMKDGVKDITPKLITADVRFLSKGNSLIAFVSSYKNKTVVIKSLATAAFQPIKKVEPIGYKIKVKWKQTPEGLLIDMPSFSIPEIPIVGFKII